MQSDVNSRRAMRQKKARRRRLRAAFIFFLIVALITLAIMCFTVFFPIKGIHVSGSEIYSKSEIIKASKLTTDDQLFAVSEQEIENNIRKALPYVDSIELKRVLPNKVNIAVTDAKEYACYKSGESYFILSDSGYILKAQNEKPENVFEIAASDISGNVGEQAKYKKIAEQQLVTELVDALTSEDINIDKIDVTSILQIKITVEDRFIVELGKNEYIEQKIAHLSGMIDSIPDRDGTINLSMWTPENSQGTFVENIG